MSGQSESAGGDFTEAEMESGRRMFACDWTFLKAAASPASLPPMAGLEIAFAGRSNVGKSSLINALTGRRALARTSSTPGRTRELIFFRSPHRLVLVDLPGYGYAAAAKSKAAAWTGFAYAYLRARATLARIYLLVDARRGLTAADDPVLGTLGRAGVSHEIVLTKCDEVNERELALRRDATMAAIRGRPAAFPGLIVTSARTGAGIPTLRAAIARLLLERGELLRPLGRQ